MDNERSNFLQAVKAVNNFYETQLKNCVEHYPELKPEVERRYNKGGVFGDSLPPQIPFKLNKSEEDKKELLKLYDKQKKLHIYGV